MIPDWAKDVKMEDLDETGKEEFVALAKDIGVENFVKVVFHFQGRAPYIPMSLFYKIRNRSILSDYKKHGKNITLIMKKYCLAENTVREILKSFNSHQTNLFGD